MLNHPPVIIYLFNTKNKQCILSHGYNKFNVPSNIHFRVGVDGRGCIFEYTLLSFKTFLKHNFRYFKESGTSIFTLHLVYD